MARPVARRSRADHAGLPDWIAPQLTQLVDAAPDGDEWLHEIKFDVTACTRGSTTALSSCSRAPGLTGRHKYPPIAAAVASLDAGQAYLDGELSSCPKRRTRGSTCTYPRSTYILSHSGESPPRQQNFVGMLGFNRTPEKESQVLGAERCEKAMRRLDHRHIL
jgi:hypothetical protein